MSRRAERDGCRAQLYAHTADAIDFAALRGKSVAVIGGAASAFDAAAVALEAGAAPVHLFARRADARRDRRSSGCAAIPAPTTITPSCRTPCAGIRRSASAGPARPRRATRSSGCCGSRISICIWRRRGCGAGRGRPHRGAGRRRGIPLRFRDRRHRLFRRSAGPPRAGRFRRRDPAVARPLRAAAGRGGPAISARIPISAPGRNISKSGRARAPYLGDIHVHNPAGFVSCGLPVGDVPSMKRGVAADRRRISRDLFLADLGLHERRLTADVAPISRRRYTTRRFGGEREKAARGTPAGRTLSRERRAPPTSVPVGAGAPISEVRP